MRTHRSAHRMPGWPAWRRPLAWATAVLALVLMTACGVEYDVVIHNDDTVDLTYTVWDSSGLEIISEETCTQEAMSSYSSPLPPGTQATYTYTTRGKDPACQISGSAIPLSELEDRSGAWSVTHEGREYVFSLSPSALSQAGAAEAATGMRATVSVTFPGKVSSANGEIDGSTVTWRGVTSSSERLEARGYDSAFGPLPLFSLLIGSMVLVLLVLIAVGFAISRRRKQAEQAALRHLMQEQAQASSAPSALVPAPPYPVYPQTAPALQGQHPPVASPPASAGYSRFPLPGQPPAAGGYAPDRPGAGSAEVPLDEPYPQSPIPGHMPSSPSYQPPQHLPQAAGPDEALQERVLPTYPVPLSGQMDHAPQAPPSTSPYSSNHSEPYRPPDAPSTDH